ncbi:MAG: hypothetical protein AAFX06_27870 [Planctomycetota bacterium]
MYAREVIVDEFRRAVDNLFQSQCRDDGYDSSSLSPDQIRGQEVLSAEKTFSAAVTLEGDDIKSRLSLVSRLSTLRKLNPGFVADPSDWVGEISNLLMGSLKNKLSEYEVETQLGIPESQDGPDLLLTRAGGMAQFAHWVNFTHGDLIVVLYFKMDWNTKWIFNPNKPAAMEGDVVLF